MVAPYYSDEQVTIYLGDCLEVLADYEDKSIDYALCEAPWFVGETSERWQEWVLPRFGQIMRVSNNIVASCSHRRLIDYHEVCAWDHLVSLTVPDGRNGLEWEPYAVWGGKPRTTMLDIPSVKTSEGWHPSAKSLVWAQRILSLFPESEVVLDVFMGSGPFVRVAKKMGKKAIGIDTEEAYCEGVARCLSN